MGVKRYPYTILLLTSMVVVISIYGAVQLVNALAVNKDMPEAGNGMEVVAETGTEVERETEVETGTKMEILAQGNLGGASGEALSVEPSFAEPSSTEVVSSEMAIAGANASAETVALVPATTEVFQDALFIGDSRTVGLMEYGDLGGAEVFADTGMSVFKVQSASVKVRSGGKKTLQEVLEGQQFGKVYIMLGLNELGYPYDSIMTKYRELVALVQEKQPGAMIFLEANLHISQKRSESSDVYNNAKINQVNDGVKQMADDAGIFYLDINLVFDDASGNLDSSYTVDDSHVLGKYYATWSQWIVEQTAAILNQRMVEE